jgi:prevent-host-death family protein
MRKDDLPRIEDLPRRSATDVKNRFAKLVNEVRATGVVAVTQRGKVEMVAMDAAIYRKMAGFSNDAEEDHRRATVLAELSAEFDRRLARLKHPDAGDRVDAIMNARGRSKRRPKAGSSF